MDKPRPFVWHHPGWYLLIPLVVYLLVGGFVRKKAILVLGLCERHRRRRFHLSLASIGVFFLGLAGLYGSARSGDALVLLVASMVILASLLLRIAAMRILRPVFIDQHEIHLKGCGPAFLDSLPTR
jgi:quinol-cytochrome oxidoreductase complex cytochrome b subunit